MENPTLPSLTNEPARDILGRLALENRGDLLSFSQKSLEKFRIKLEVTSTSSKLNEGSGNIIFANHKSSLDTIIIINALQEKGIKIPQLKLFLSEQTYPFYASHFSKDNFLVATNKPRFVLEQTQKALEHIATGGSVFIFPSGKPTECGDSLFKPGLTYLIENAPKNSFIIPCHIGEYSFTGLSQTVPVRIETYKLEEWSQLLSSELTRQENTKIIQDRYKQIFTLNNKS
ncbi:MAG: 1-acyl-sn-glycerol-3-phosphate acyltransferase [Ignavibacteriaceae bacterium]|jgi:hypothetical protein|nr:1-acyl-sn-glycerol-3-phosphate acyltransferase [Ignavibacteriaceae bacterium]